MIITDIYIGKVSMHSNIMLDFKGCASRMSENEKVPDSFLKWLIGYLDKRFGRKVVVIFLLVSSAIPIGIAGFQQYFDYQERRLVNAAESVRLSIDSNALVSVSFRGFSDVESPDTSSVFGLLSYKATAGESGVPCILNFTTEQLTSHTVSGSPDRLSLSYRADMMGVERVSVLDFSPPRIYLREKLSFTSRDTAKPYTVDILFGGNSYVVESVLEDSVEPEVVHHIYRPGSLAIHAASEDRANHIARAVYTLAHLCSSSDSRTDRVELSLLEPKG